LDPCQYLSDFECFSEFIDAHKNQKVVFLCSRLDNFSDFLEKILNLDVWSIVSKNAHYQEVAFAFDKVARGECYFSDYFIENKNTYLLELSKNGLNDGFSLEYSKSQKLFFELLASDLTYVQIADKFNLSPKTIDFHRANLFKQFGVKLRQGLVVELFRRKLIV